MMKEVISCKHSGKVCQLHNLKIPGRARLPFLICNKLDPRLLIHPLPAGGATYIRLLLTFWTESFSQVPLSILHCFSRYVSVLPAVVLISQVASLARHRMVNLGLWWGIQIATCLIRPSLYSMNHFLRLLQGLCMYVFMFVNKNWWRVLG